MRRALFIAGQTYLWLNLTHLLLIFSWSNTMAFSQSRRLFPKVEGFLLQPYPVLLYWALIF
ncbi:AAC_HP2_G0048380.mRNA.1.CDS.1 [Saccharomyces cerevisiae]|nr:AAC_HP2_G0048380.mRNA.1.CDS.1 [Saccharomyces cerevisiae]CAI6767697.1 AAC_HP2_G0048380.mRNA.1.CDS.1 [Saccharomyces cerevisiae]CAI6777573.1 AAC_HP1_G0049900.mRNA.1.CDS.1 [Saccharomyces cerevisiae]CAI6884082.1 AAC_collapsed_G0049930.mRNA.1.CDS.1 [Saccharomyces cerevisiae]